MIISLVRQSLMKANLLPPFPSRNRHSPESIHTNPYEVEETLNSLSVGKAAGPDGINNRLLKQLSKPLSNPLSDLFNSSLAHDKVPTTWKEANITPIFKKDDPSQMSNYRLISLLNTIDKVMEKLFINIFYFFQRQQCYNNFTVWFCTWRFNYQSISGHI